MASEPTIRVVNCNSHTAEISCENDPLLDDFGCLFKQFMKINRNFGVNMNVKSIDGILLSANVDIAECVHYARDKTKSVRFTFYCDWQHKRLYTEYCESPDELKNFITDILPNLKYNQYTNQFTSTEPIQELAQQLMKHLPKNENVVSLYDECCVCLELVKTKTSCEHPLCYKCESKIKNKKCPLCRVKYEHSQQECDEEDE
tara:strand:- start:43 stop:648 length:606 start_codon:yes stop_codon:yes gene_type:complete